MAKTELSKRCSILVVEDHRETLIFLDMALEDDYIVHSATNASEALDELSEHHFDLLLVDIALRDEVDGVELVAQIRLIPEYAETPMIAMTAHHLRESNRFYLEHGFDEYLPKPFFPEDLFKLIEDHIGSESPLHQTSC